MFDSFIELLIIVALVLVVARLYSRMGTLERQMKALNDIFAARPAASSVAAEAFSPEAETPTSTRSLEPEAAITEAIAREQAETESGNSGPWGARGSEPSDTPLPKAAPEAKPRDLESALGTRWTVWVGGLALALGGVFLVRYSIEAGFFGPSVRLTMASLFGIALAAAGEFLRRTGYKVPLEGVAGAYIPAILTAAGAFTLFGVVYAAHGIYGFIGPAVAFPLLGMIGVATIAASLAHGQALAGVGLVGSLVTPVLVASQAPNAWALFVYLAIVLAANTAIARLRDWRLLAAAGFAGTGLWCLVYLAEAFEVELPAALFINLAMLTALALLWLRTEATAPGRFGDWPSLVVGLVSGLALFILISDPLLGAEAGDLYGAVLAVALLTTALVRRDALPLLFGAGGAVALGYARLGLSADFSIGSEIGEVVIEGLPAAAASSRTVWIGSLMAALFLAGGIYAARKFAARAPRRAAAWMGFAALVPVVILALLWIAFGNIDRDFGYAAGGLLLAALLAAGGEATARRENLPLTGGPAVSLALAGAMAAWVLTLHMAFGGLWTTMLVGASAAFVSLATRVRTYPVLGWLSVGAALVTLARVAFDPTIVGAAFLGTTPVFNALLPGYGVPALAFAFTAWQLARTTGGRPRLVMEAAASLLALLTLAMLVRHAMNDGAIDSGAPTLAEQAIYTLIALGAGAILIALDLRSPSSVFRTGSMAAGIVSTILIVGQHFIWLNPLRTNDSTGTIPVFDLLFLAYLLPAAAAAALALYARGKRPRWYSAMLGLLASALAFGWATLSVRRLFQGEFIGAWKGMTQLETYAYSALWLAMGVALLVVGVRLRSQPLRIASGVLIAIAIAKVFVFDMSELEGVLRATSFIGLGVVLIGIGLFYQKLLTRSAKGASAG